jgi:hypothetical protein
MMRIGLVLPVCSGASILKPVNGALICLNHASFLIDLLLVPTKRNFGFIFALSVCSLRRRIQCRQKPIIIVLPLSSIPQATAKPFWLISSAKLASAIMQESFWRLPVDITN